MSNSSLVDYTKISPNKTSPRNHEIDTITIHCYVGQASVESAGNWFAKRTTLASCNYMIGSDGRVGLIVEEKDRSWCTSSKSNDHRAITIECACDKTHPYAVNDAVYKTLIDLIADICKRNNIKQLLWKGDKSLIGQVDKQNMTVHRWFKNKACPGEYLYSRHGEIAEKVNAIINPKPVEKQQSSGELYCVQTGAFTKIDNAKKLAADLQSKGFSTYITQADGYYKVQVGAYSLKMNAVNMQRKLQAAGYDTFITIKRSDKTEGGSKQNNTTPSPVVEVKKTNEEIAREVIAGKWGNGTVRKKALTEAGYDYEAIRAIVNKLV